LAMILTTMRMNSGGDPQVSAALRSLCDSTAGRPGCRGCEVFQQVDHPEQVLYLEQWDDWDALRAHLKSERCAQLLQILELSVDRPELEFRETQETRGLELVESVQLGEGEQPSGCRERRAAVI